MKNGNIRSTKYKITNNDEYSEINHHELVILIKMRKKMLENK